MILRLKRAEMRGKRPKMPFKARERFRKTQRARKTSDEKYADRRPGRDARLLRPKPIMEGNTPSIVTVQRSPGASQGRAGQREVDREQRIKGDIAKSRRPKGRRRRRQANASASANCGSRPRSRSQIRALCVDGCAGGMPLTRLIGSTACNSSRGGADGG